MVHSACVHLRVLRASAADLRQKLSCFATNNTNGPNDRLFSDTHPRYAGGAAAVGHSSVLNSPSALNFRFSWSPGASPTSQCARSNVGKLDSTACGGAHVTLGWFGRRPRCDEYLFFAL